jgi:hypothetical protein
MYNTDFKVKYHDIKTELISKLENNKDEEYVLQDILDICSKLYRDELTSVFYADHLMDDKVDIGMRTVLDKMMINPDFKNIVDEMKQYMYAEETNINEETTHMNEVIVILSLFSENTFYILHKCICQQFSNGAIDIDLLVELKYIVLEFLNK